MADPLSEVTEAMTIKVTNESGEEIDAPLLDVQKVLSQHLKEVPVLLTGGSVIVIGTIAFRDFQRIRKQHKSWIKENEGHLVEGQRIIEKKDAGETLTEEEEQILSKSMIDEFPYTSELIHAMITKPAMTLEDFRSLVRRVWLPKDWTRVQIVAQTILQETYINVTAKN